MKLRHAFVNELIGEHRHVYEEFYQIMQIMIQKQADSFRMGSMLILLET